MAKGCRLDVQIPDGEWETLKCFRDVALAQAVVATLNGAGISAVLSCACGSYLLGECELCDNESQHRGETIRELTEMVERAAGADMVPLTEEDMEPQSEFERRTRG